MSGPAAAVIKQHLIDPETCIRCNTCETTCPSGAALLADADSYFFVCGLRSMEEGVVRALRDVAEEAGLRWETLDQALKRDGRLHLETY
jgi:ferredoxin